jgi:hypothetical protein
MTEPTPADNDPERLAELLSELREPPRAWIEAAQRLPAARAELDGIVARAEADAVYRERTLAGLEQALRAAGQPSSPDRVAALRARLTELG